jgi:hypothetical protein
VGFSPFTPLLPLARNFRPGLLFPDPPALGGQPFPGSDRWQRPYDRRFLPAFLRLDAKHAEAVASVIFCNKLQKGHEHLTNHGVLPGPIQDGGDTQFFEIRDSEGHVIQICKEP